MFRLKTLYLLITLFATLAFAAAEPLDTYISFLTDEQKATLLEEKELVVYDEGAPGFRLLPSVSLAITVQNEFDGFKGNVSDEALFLLPKVEKQDALDYIYRQIRDIGTLTGIQYHSNHYREWKTLFDNVFETDETGSDTFVKYSPKENIPDEERIIIHIEDVNFGSGYYEAVYFNSNQAAGFGITNLTSLKYKLVPLIGKEKVRFQMLMIPTDEYLLVYGVCGVQAGSLIQRMIHLPSSFYTRMKALRDWFTKQIYTQ